MNSNSLTARIAALDPAVRACVVSVARATSPTFTLAQATYRDVPKAARRMTLPDGARAILSLANEVKSARSARGLARARQTGNRSPLASGRAALARYNATALELRTEDRTEAAFLKAAKRVMRHGGSGGSTWNVILGGATASYVEAPRRFTEWKHGNPYAKVADDHVVHIPARWWVRVAPIGDGSGVVDGRLVLDARRIVGTADGDRAVYSATVARPGRGYTAVVEQAFISCWSDVATVKKTFAAATAEAVPDAIRQRDAAAKEADRLDALDEAVLANLEF